MPDVYVIGGSLSALAAALELAEVGLSVRIAPRDARDPDPAGVRDPDGAMAAFLEHVAGPIAPGGPSNRRIAPRSSSPDALAVPNAKGQWAPVPNPNVFGIPAVTISTEALAILGGRGAARAYLDRVKPLLTIGKTHDLGTLVRKRLGEATLDRMVQPIVRDRYGRAASEVEVAIAAPGLNETLTRAGSLSAAVLAYAERHVARETRVAPSAGWRMFREAAVERLLLYAAETADEMPRSVRAVDDGWIVEEEDGAFEARALVLDAQAGGTRELPGLEGALDALRPEEWRAEARFPIADAAAPQAPGAGALVRTVEDEAGRPWSMRVERDEAGAWGARLSGPASAAPFRLEAGLGRIAAAAGLDPLEAPEIAWAVAPYAAAGRRDREAAALAAWRDEREGVLPVGELLHGGDAAAAVADARAAAVRLRRRLTGIAG